MSFPDKPHEGPDHHSLILYLGIALRRLLLVVDKRRTEAKEAEEVLRQADRYLIGNPPPKRERGK